MSDDMIVLTEQVCLKDLIKISGSKEKEIKLCGNVGWVAVSGFDREGKHGSRI